MKTDLTEREAEILELVKTDGRPLKELAFHLGISYGRLKTSQSIILQKIGRGSRVELLVRETERLKGEISRLQEQLASTTTNC